MDEEDACGFDLAVEGVPRLVDADVGAFKYLGEVIGRGGRETNV